jgi:hypothetical protein
MELNIQLIKPGDFVKTTPTGELDLNSSKKILSGLASTSDLAKQQPMLIDLRNTTSILNTVDLFELGSGLLEYGGAFRRKTAVLTRNDDSFERGSFFELVARNRGYNVKAFITFEDAIMWLAEVEDILKNEG